MPTPRKVLTPGSYKEPDKAASAAKTTPKKGQTTPKKTARKTGRPSSAKKKGKKPARKIKHRAAYTEEDMKEAVRLVQEEGMSCKAACKEINEIKKNEVPRMTLNDRLKRDLPNKQPALGRPQELSRAVEEALVKCLVMCADFQYPMKKKDLQDLVQSYCIEHNVETRFQSLTMGTVLVLCFIYFPSTTPFVFCSTSIKSNPSFLFW
jgi:DNA gyrase/topoisomerase IV subunit A